MNPARQALNWGGLLLAVCAVCLPTHAHVVLEQTSAEVGSSYRASFRVGHGCGALATTGISVKLPPGVQGAKPMPKPGWALVTRKAALSQPYTSHGKTVTEDVAEVTWNAQSRDAALPDAHYDEFVLRATLPKVAGPLWFQVVQTCARDDGTLARNEWVEIPASGTATRGLKAPAALLIVKPDDDQHSHH